MWQYGELIDVDYAEDCQSLNKPVEVGAIVMMLISVAIALGVGLLTSYYVISSTEQIQGKEKKNEDAPADEGAP